MIPRSGEVLQVGCAASVQFREPFLFRVIRVHGWPTYDGWQWLDGYELNATGDAVSRRTIFVQLAGLEQPQVVPTPRPAGRTPSRCPRSRAPPASR